MSDGPASLGRQQPSARWLRPCAELLRGSERVPTTCPRLTGGPPGAPAQRLRAARRPTSSAECSWWRPAVECHYRAMQASRTRTQVASRPNSLAYFSRLVRKVSLSSIAFNSRNRFCPWKVAKV